MLKQEVMRRVPESRVRKLKNGELIALLKIDEYQINDKEDIAFITDNEMEYRTLLLGKEEHQKMRRQLLEVPTSPLRTGFGIWR